MAVLLSHGLPPLSSVTSPDFGGRSMRAAICGDCDPAFHLLQCEKSFSLLVADGHLPGYVFLHSRDYRHTGIEEDEEHDETADEGSEYDV